MITELNVMKRLKPHPHVLKLIGCCSISGKSDTTIIKVRYFSMYNDNSYGNFICVFECTIVKLATYRQFTNAS